MDHDIRKVVADAMSQCMPASEAKLIRAVRLKIEDGSLKEQAELVARAHMIRYRAFLAAGFDEMQALLLSSR